jgi:hypothetical protein
MQEEAEEYHQRNKTQAGKTVGRPAGREAYTGQSAMRYEQQASDTMVKEPQFDESQDGDASRSGTEGHNRCITKSR